MQAWGQAGNSDVETALVIGAGGAARAVVAGLQDRAFERIVVANRTRAKAEDLAARSQAAAARWT